MEVEPVLARVRHGGGVPREARAREPQRRAAPARPDPGDPRLVVEREAAKLVVQRPALAGPVFDGLGEECFTSPAYAAIRAAVAKAGGAARSGGGAEWVARVAEAAETDSVRDLVTELAVEPLQVVDEDDPRYAEAVLVRLEEMALTRRIQELKSRLQRLNPVENADEYNRMFGELIELERHKKGLRAKAVGEL
jgi:DNA primase